MNLPRIKFSELHEDTDWKLVSGSISEENERCLKQCWRYFYKGKGFTYYGYFFKEVIKKNNHQVWINMN